MTVIARDPTGRYVWNAKLNTAPFSPVKMSKGKFVEISLIFCRSLFWTFFECV